MAVFSGCCQNILIFFSPSGHISARGLPARMAGTDGNDMCHLSHGGRQASGREQTALWQNPPQALLHSQQGKFIMGWTLTNLRRLNIHDYTLTQHERRGNTHCEALTLGSHFISELPCGLRKKMLFAVFKKHRYVLYIFPTERPMG